MSGSDRNDADDPAVAAAFLDLYLRDQAGEGVRPLEAYQDRFPRHAELIAREYAALQRNGAGGDPGSETSIGPYRIVRELGRGGQGVVYLARDPRLKRQVALKVLEGHALYGDRLRRFQREAEVASRLEHSGICAVFDSGMADGVAFIAMRYVEGRTLATEIAEARAKVATPETRGGDSRGNGRSATIVPLFEEIARALHTAHEAGVVHRDVKPGNLLLSAEGNAVLVDFGLARAVESDEATLTRTGDVFGTPAYMAPEQLRGRSDVDRRADVYSLGATLFEALVLRPPFEAATREGLFRAILEEDVPDPRSLVPSLSRDLAIVVRTALEKEPDRRYATAADLAEDLRRVREREPIRARPPGRAELAWRWIDKNRAVASLAAGLFFALAAGLAITARLLESSENARSELAETTVELEAALVDAERGRLSEKRERIERLIAEGFQEAMGASVGESAATFEAVLAEEPSNKTALLGRAWVETMRPGRVGEVLQRFAGELAEDPDVIWMRGWAAELAGRTREAERLYEQAGADAGHLRLYLVGLRTIDNFRSFDPERVRAAVALFRRANLQAPRPQYPYLHSLLMAAAYARERSTMDEAAEALERHWPEFPGTWDAIAQFYLPLDVERAKRALHRHLELKPAAAPCCGLAYEALGRGAVDEALTWFDKGIEIEPDFAPVWFMKGDLCARQEDLETARACFLESLERDPAYPPVYAALVDVYVKLDDIAAAREELEHVASLDPTLPHAWRTLAELETEHGDPTRARALLRRAVDSDPYDAASLAAWSETLVAAEDVVAAAAEARGLAEAHSDSHSAWLALGRVRQAGEDLDGAREAFQRGLAIHPDDPDLAAALAALTQR